MFKYTNKISKDVLIITILICSLFFSGCSKADSLKVKLGLKNNDFEYIKQNKIEKIVIQNTRDQGYRFIVSDKRAIQELYEILSSAKEVKEKSTLKPDYVFEMHEAHDKIHKFNYIAGLDKKNGGNLYSEDKVYIVSKRIDNDIIKSFWNIRIPKDFTDIYYKSILKTLTQYLKDTKITKSIGINLNEDIGTAKFILSTDLEEFKGDIKEKYQNASLAEGDNSSYNVLMTIKTQGYKRLLYKSIITFYNRTEKSEVKYYVKGEYENRGWNIEVSNKKPDDF
ncbi:hypothetical protein BD780_003968 [Clostridium tetanomorphum]|uniref:hypothetical protein n=1 Tax=Clostridium tetanomorphum TaxID=1553 RepID=UPI000449E645|nr:hypothetical protein [Clostridium tetanomorphum]KAJ49856.1 hypothetical protein CTM_20896 [Clostridium tetanomorphum DSM 665]MBP1866115.1 hypothetical protein [Clostridium tetanomorphum]NRS86743.1 hypothetical protein [Clostridium tetanomorphum]SQC00468.1 putative lipoprotein [Clostridium tetanomorphum]